MVATQPQLGRAQRDVDIIAGAQAHLKEPLVLGRLRSIEFRLSPALDPNGKPWFLGLSEVLGDTRHESRASGQASPEGVFTAPVEGGVRYRISVMDSARHGFYSETLKADSADSVHEIRIEMVRVVGSVTRRGKPIAGAEVTFGGEFGAVSVPMICNSDGEFEGILPRSGRWPVLVHSKEPAVKREFKAIDVEPVAAGAVARVSLELPSTRLSVEVVDENGDPRSGIVDVTDADGGFTQRVVNESGLLEIEGLPAGTITLKASARPDVASEVVQVALQEDIEGPRTRLVVKKQRHLTGKVISGNGPVVGAALWPVFDLPNSLSVPRASNADGEFDFTVPPGAREVSVEVYPPGYALRVVTTSVGGSDPVTIAVDNTGGSLVASVSRSVMKGRSVFLVHGGRPIRSSKLLNGWAQVSESSDSLDFKFGPIEAGPYSVCVLDEKGLAGLLAGAVPTDACTATTLVPRLGEASVRIPSGR